MRYWTWFSNFALECDEAILSFAGLWVALFIPHALEWDSAKVLRTREINVRDGTFVGECSQRALSP